MANTLQTRIDIFTAEILALAKAIPMATPAKAPGMAQALHAHALCRAGLVEEQAAHQAAQAAQEADTAAKLAQANAPAPKPATLDPEVTQDHDCIPVATQDTLDALADILRGHNTPQGLEGLALDLQGITGQAAPLATVGRALQTLVDGHVARMDCPDGSHAYTYTWTGKPAPKPTHVPVGSNGYGAFSEGPTKNGDSGCLAERLPTLAAARAVAHGADQYAAVACTTHANWAALECHQCNRHPLAEGLQPSVEDAIVGTLAAGPMAAPELLEDLCLQDDCMEVLNMGQVQRLANAMVAAGILCTDSIGQVYALVL